MSSESDVDAIPPQRFTEHLLGYRNLDYLPLLRSTNHGKSPEMTGLATLLRALSDRLQYLYRTYSGKYACYGMVFDFWSPLCSVSTVSMDRSGDPSLSEQLHALREDAPSRYALLKRYHTDLERILEQAPRNYASAKQLYSTWEDPPFQPQILGQLLSTIANLGILRVHAHRSNRNRYDLTAYDSTRMHELATLFTGEAESTSRHSPYDQ